jgi:hypothetical protein
MIALSLKEGPEKQCSKMHEFLSLGGKFNNDLLITIQIQLTFEVVGYLLPRKMMITGIEVRHQVLTLINYLSH